MSSDDGHWQSHMTPSARNICTHAVFATSSFNFSIPAYFVSHCCYGRRVFQKKYSRAVWLWCGKWHVKGHTYVGVHHVDTMFLFCSIQCALNHLKTNFTWLCHRLISFLCEYYKTHQFGEYIFSWDRCLCYPSLCLLSDILAPHNSNIDSHALSLLTIFVCWICCYGFHQLEVFG